MQFLLALAAIMAPASAVSAGVPVGIRTLEITDPSRPDPVLPAYRRTWQVALYYPAIATPGQAPVPYAPQADLIAAMAPSGYYDVPAATLANWSKKPGVAIHDAPPAKGSAERPLIVIAPGSGMAAFNYSRLAAALVGKGYAVAVVALPYVGISLLNGKRLTRADDFPGLNDDDPVKWRPAVREWSKDLSLSLDRLLNRNAAVPIDRNRVVVVGHSTGGIIALQLCRDDPRVVSCGDFEGAPEASDAYEGSMKKPIFVTASRSAKPDRPFVRPDLANPFWSYLTKNNDSAWAIGITKASHMSFSDAPYEMPNTLSRFGGELMSADRSFELMTGLVDAFARAYGPKGAGNSEFDAFLAKQPEVLAQLAKPR